MRSNKLHGSALGSPLKLIVPLLLSVTGCSSIPGMSMQERNGASNVVAPEMDDGELVTAQADIVPITAEYLVTQFRRQSEEERSRERPNYTAYRNRLDSYEYRIGPRDVLNVTVWDHPELTIPAGEFRDADVAGQLVAEDGTMFYPYAGVVKVAGLTVAQVRATLTKRLARYIASPQLDVRVADFRSQKAYVVGEVNKPGVQPVTDVPLTVTDAVARSGDVTRDADMRHLILSRGDRVYLIDLLALYEAGDLNNNPILQDGDILNVPNNEFNKIFVLGEIVKPSALFMDKGRKTLAEALAEAGGVDPTTSDAGRIYVIRTGGEKPKIFHLDARSPDALILANRFALAPRDVVYVDNTALTRWNRVITQILPTVQTINQFAGTSWSSLGF
jgi:polysaccharide export outer membrane protein